MNRFASFAAATLASAGIAFAPAPAAAGDDDIGKIIAALAVAGIAAKVINDRRDRKKREAARAETANHVGRFGESYDGRRVIDGTVRPYNRYDDRRPRHGQGFKKQALPEQCLVTVETNRGSRLAYGARCLDRTYRFADRLPGSCETVVRTPRGFRTVYGARCLRRDGWRVAGR